MWGWCGREKSTLLAGQRKQLMSKIEKKNTNSSTGSMCMGFRNVEGSSRRFGIRLPLRNRAERCGQRSAMFFSEPSDWFQFCTCMVLIKIHLMLENEK